MARYATGELQRLAQGRGSDTRAAVEAARAAAGSGGDRWHLLAVASEVCCASGDTAGPAPPLTNCTKSPRRRRIVARGDRRDGGRHLLLAEGRPGDAAAVLRAARDAWSELRVPYGAARAPVLLGEVCHALGDIDGTQLEWDAARYRFEELSASDAVAVDGAD